jgi:hypothetical protein
MADAVSRQVVPAVSKDRSEVILSTKQSQKTLRSCETSETAHPTHRRIPQDFNPEQHRCENLKSYRGPLFIVCIVMNPLQPVVTIHTAQ